MASYDGTITLDPTIINTKEELEDRLKKVVWEWQVDGDEVTSKANLDLLRSAQVCYQALRVQYGGIGNSTPVSPNYNTSRLEEVLEIWNKYAPAKYQETLSLLVNKTNTISIFIIFIILASVLLFNFSKKE